MYKRQPECLASNAALLAVGPREANGIDYVFSNGLACCVTARDPRALTGSIRKLASDAEYRTSLGSRGQRWAFERMNVFDARRRFEQKIREAAADRTPEGFGASQNGVSGVAHESSVIVGPYAREAKAKLDETELLARLLI